MNLRIRYSLFFLVLIIISCGQKHSVDLIVHNAVVYTADSAFSTVSAFAIKDGKIVATGTDSDILKSYDAKEKVNAEGMPVYPGFIDSHTHFLHYGIGLGEVNLVGTTSFDHVVKKLVHEGQCNKSGWMKGRGWDQNDWDNKSFPSKDILDSIFPHSAIFIKRIDGHAALANAEALRRAGITEDTKIEGGIVEIKNGKLTGILIDNAVDLVEKVIPPPSDLQMANAIQIAEKNCFASGITTVDDAGLTYQEVRLIDSLQKSGTMQIRLYAMLSPSPENEKAFYGRRNSQLKSERLNVQSVKIYADGALGSRGACLLAPYSDSPMAKGFLLHPADSMQRIIELCYTNGYQANSHCIGDSANRLILKLYAGALRGKNDRRWRIEHAQVIDPSDFSLFENNSILPSVQPTHATSDMYWAAERLGANRIKSAYAYKDLLKAASKVALGTDFPVENMNPIITFYAAVSRKDLKGFPESGFQKENALDRKETLWGMTRWGAFANFEEKEKGSIESGKFADFVILDQDIMTIDEDKIPNTKVLYTYVGGLKVFEAKK